jgi:GNAT superfamily N-acetyltransferase
VPRMRVEVSAVRSRRDRKEFIELPFRLHSSSQQWIPPLKLERRLFHSRKVNAYFKHAEAQEFLARTTTPPTRVVGRISAQFNLSYDQEHGPGTGMFGFLELEDEADILPPLLDAARAWLSARGRSHMIGPMDYSMNEECGVLFEGFEREPMVRQPWHPPYYRRRCEEAGLQKAMDLYMWEADIADREKIRPAIVELAQRALDKHGIRLEKMKRRRLHKDVHVFGDVYNTAWRNNWDFVPYSKSDLAYLAQDLQLVYDRNWFMLAKQHDETIGIAITFPDVNQVLKTMNGRLLPLGWWRFLRKSRVIDRVRVSFLGVKPEYQHTGAGALLYMEHFEMAQKTPQTWGEMGWVLETNRAMNRGIEAMGGRIVKRFRVYESRF